MDTQERINKIRSTLPELPWETRTRLKHVYALSDRNVDVLLGIDSGRQVQYDGEDPGERCAVKYFDKIVDGFGNPDGKKRDPKRVANWYVLSSLRSLRIRQFTAPG